MSYTWARGGKQIKDATKRVYSVQRRDVGTRITCSVVVTLAPAGNQFATRAKAVKVKPARLTAVNDKERLQSPHQAAPRPCPAGRSGSETQGYR